MQDKFERLVKIAYKRYKSDHLQAGPFHTNEEDMACFLEDRLSAEEVERIKLHLISCNACADAFVARVRLKVAEEGQVPQELLQIAKDLVRGRCPPSILEIILKVKDGVLGLLSTTGDVVVGDELVPAPILRSHQIKDFKDEVTILKDFRDYRVELKIENKRAHAFNLTILIKDKKTSRAIKDLRVTLIKDGLELESYLAESGKVTFEYVLLGKYTIEISGMNDKIACIVLDIKTQSGN